MKKNIYLIVVFLVFFTSFNICLANNSNYSKLFIDEPIFLFKVKLNNLMNNFIFKSIYKGEIKNSIDILFNEFEKRTSLSFTRDILELGIFLNKSVDLKKEDLNNFGIFLKGNFEINKIFTEIKKLKSDVISIEKINNNEVIRLKDYKNFAVMFLNSSFILIVSDDLISKYLDMKKDYNFKLEDEFENSSFYFKITLSNEFKNILTSNIPLTIMPPNLKNIMNNLINICIFFQNNNLNFKFDFVNETGAKEAKQNFEALKGILELNINSMLREVDETIKNTNSVFELILSEKLNQKYGLNFLVNILKTITFENVNESLTFKINIPTGYFEILKPNVTPALVVIIGSALNVIITNYKDIFSF